MKTAPFKIFIAFIVLFFLYHSAEYWIVFKNNALLFLSVQILFFIAAFFFGKWFDKGGLSTWGYSKFLNSGKEIFFGIMIGILMYGIPFLITLIVGSEKIVSFPSFEVVLSSGIPFFFGVVFSSVSEDILTRGLFYRYFKNKISPIAIVIFTSGIYVLNHIYKLNAGWETLSYLFLLGIIFALPMIKTGKLWMTSAMHWVGNCFFFGSHQLITIEEKSGFLSYNTVLSIFLILLILMYLVFNKKAFSRN